MNKTIRLSSFVAFTVIFYFFWSIGGDQLYGKFIAKGIDSFTAKVSSIESAELKDFPEQKKSYIVCKYSDRTTKINMEFCLPVVLLLAWQFSLFTDKMIPRKKAFKYFGINYLILFVLQINFPLLLFNISQSQFRSMSLFIGLQIFGFIVFFLILKDSILLKYLNKQIQQN